MTTYCVYNRKRRQYRSDATRNYIHEVWHNQTDFFTEYRAEATPYETFEKAKAACGENEHVERQSP